MPLGDYVTKRRCCKDIRFHAGWGQDRRVINRRVGWQGKGTSLRAGTEMGRPTDADGERGRAQDSPADSLLRRLERYCFIHGTVKSRRAGTVGGGVGRGLSEVRDHCQGPLLTDCSLTVPPWQSTYRAGGVPAGGHGPTPEACPTPSGCRDPWHPTYSRDNGETRDQLAGSRSRESADAHNSPLSPFRQPLRLREQRRGLVKLASQRVISNPSA